MLIRNLLHPPRRQLSLSFKSVRGLPMFKSHGWGEKKHNHSGCSNYCTAAVNGRLDQRTHRPPVSAGQHITVLLVQWLIMTIGPRILEIEDLGGSSNQVDSCLHLEASVLTIHQSTGRIGPLVEDFRHDMEDRCRGTRSVEQVNLRSFSQLTTDSPPG